MAVSKIKVSFESNVQKVWEIVTSLKNYGWRSDLDRIELLNDKQFVEYTKTGYPTNFTVTFIEPYKQWEFDMENDNMKGHWIGIFHSDGERTEIEFTEEVTAKKIVMKPFVKAYLKKQQAQYVKDLKKALL